MSAVKESTVVPVKSRNLEHVEEFDFAKLLRFHSVEEIVFHVVMHWVGSWEVSELGEKC